MKIEEKLKMMQDQLKNTMNPHACILLAKEISNLKKKIRNKNRKKDGYISDV